MATENYSSQPLDITAASDSFPTRSLRTGCMSPFISTVARLCHFWPLPPPQIKPPLFLLPVEIRHIIYLYIFSSSIVDDRDNSWNCLLRSCKQINLEMSSIPIRLVISLVSDRWDARFPGHPLQISVATSEKGEKELTVSMPREMFQTDYRSKIRRYIPEYISPLFRLYVDTFTLTIYNDGNPMINRQRMPLLRDVLKPIMYIVWARDPDNNHLRRKVFLPGLMSRPPCKNFFNAKRIVVKWDGHVTGLQREDWRGVIGMALYRISMKMIRPRLHLHEHWDRKWVNDKFFIVTGVCWESRTRFRK